MNMLDRLCGATLFAALSLSLCSCGNSRTVPYTTTASAVQFTSGQAAAVVIGQADFVSNSINRGGSVGANTLAHSYAEPFVNNGTLYLPDENNNRTLVYNSIPTTNGASADFAIGQSDLVSNSSGTSATAVYHPEHVIISNGKMIQADFYNSRIIIYNSVPTTSPGTISVVVGQADKTSSTYDCTASNLNEPESIAIAGNKLIVTDGSNNRILIWNSIPTADGTAADLVLGQANFTSCDENAGGSAAANTLSYPAGMWSDGTRLAVVDNDNNRVLIWNSIPTSNDQPADLVLGQADFVSTTDNRGGSAAANTLSNPYDGVYFTSKQLFVGDTGNNRVLIWNSWPTANGQAADAVLGEPDFVTSSGGTSATLLGGPTGVFLYGKQLIVSDTGNARYLIFNGQ